MKNRRKKQWEFYHSIIGLALSGMLVQGKSVITIAQLKEAVTPSWAKEGKPTITKKTIYEHLKGFIKEGILIRRGDEYIIDEKRLGYIVGINPVSFRLSEIVKSRNVNKKVSQIRDLTYEIMADFRKMMRKGRDVPERYSIHIDFKPKLAKLDKAISMDGMNPRIHKDNTIPEDSARIIELRKEILGKWMEKRNQKLIDARR